MWAMTPMLRTFGRSKPRVPPFAIGAPVDREQWPVTSLRTRKRRVVSGRCRGRHCPLTTVCCPRVLPGEVAERLVRLGHLDRLLALAHGLALALVGGHQLLGEPEVRRPAALAADGGEE